MFRFPLRDLRRTSQHQTKTFMTENRFCDILINISKSVAIFFSILQFLHKFNLNPFHDGINFIFNSYAVKNQFVKIKI